MSRTRTEAVREVFASLGSRFREKTIPIEWETWDLIETMHIQFNNVTFLCDFGPAKSGERFDSLDFNMIEGMIQIWIGEEVKHKIEVVITPDVS